MWFVAECHGSIDFSIINVFDGRLSLLGALAGVVFSVFLYIFRNRIKLLARLYRNNREAKYVFIIIGLIITVVFSRAVYCFFYHEAKFHIAFVNEPAQFLPDSFERKIVETPWVGSGGGAVEELFPEGSVIKVTGEYAEGADKGKRVVVAYEFVRLIGSCIKKQKLHPDNVFKWLELHNCSVVSFKNAFYYDLFEIWNGGYAYLGGGLGAIIGGLYFCVRNKL
ncbi:MAG: hypothetical protein ABIH39_07665, partial [Candidatus Margulisiibacteriota bacterium]